MSVPPGHEASRGSVTQWIHDINQFWDQQAAQKLFERYFTQLISQVRSRVNRKLQSVNDAEDVAAFALSEVLCKIRDGAFPNLEDRSGLWALIITIADVRTRHLWRHANQAKRDRKRTISPEQLASPGQESTAGAFEFTSREPTPEFVASVNDQLEQLLQALSSDDYRDLLAAELSGESPDDMRRKLSERLGQDVSERTVRRKRQRMRQELQAIYGADLADSVIE